MNYRHHFHAGNFADVMKHALLIELVRAMQRKPKGCLLLDTHAGSGAYDLSLAGTGETLARKPEHPDGVGRIWGKTGLPPLLTDYEALVRAFDGIRRETGPAEGASEAPKYYPGSPWILRSLSRPQDRLVLCERHPEECEALRMSFGREKGVVIREMDGYQAVAALLPPPERRALVLIDPPFEDADEGDRIVEALREGLRRLPAGTFAVWYPLTGRAKPDALLGELAALALPPTLAVELVIDPAAPKMRGCGLLVVNPPWQFDSVAGPVGRQLAATLAQAPGAGASLRWLVPEAPSGRPSAPGGSR